MRSVVRWAVLNSPSMNTVIVAILTIGLGSLLFLRRESFPEFELDLILISVPYPGASPEEVEEGICLKIEEAIRTIAGIKKIISIAREGSGNVLAELDRDQDVQKILGEIRSEVDRIPSFPELAEDYVVREITLRQSAVKVGIVGSSKGEQLSEREERELRELAEEVRDELLMLPSISQIQLLGEKEFQIDVEIPESNLRQYGLSLRQIADIVRRQNLELPAGTLRTTSSEMLIRGKNKHLTGSEIARLAVLTQSDGVVLTLGDLGTVRDGFEDRTSYSRVVVSLDSEDPEEHPILSEDRPAMVLVIRKTSAEDLLKIVGEVKGYVETKRMPTGYELRIWGDRSLVVRDRLLLLTRNGITGLVLVFLVLSLFLEFRLAFWVALGIPVAILGTCAVMYSCGETLNMLSMFAFLMGLGIVVDDAIVIGENVYSHRQRGKTPIDAAVDGTLEVAPAVLASVGTTIIAFSPLLYVTGIMGKFLAILPFAVISMLVISLFESIFILPCHLAHVRSLEGGGVGPFGLGRAHKWTEECLHKIIHEWYVPTLDWLLDRPEIVYCTSLSALMISFGLIWGGFTPFVIFPKIDGNAIRANVIYPTGTPASTVEVATKKLQDAALKIDGQYREEQGKPILELVHRSIGYIRNEEEFRSEFANSVGQVDLQLINSEERAVPSEEIIKRWRERAGELPGIEKLIFETVRIAPAAKPIEFKLLGNDFEKLETTAEEVKARLASYDGVFDVSDDSRPGKWELQLKIRPEAEAMGIQLEDLARTVRASYYGEEVMRLQRGRHEVKLMVRHPASERRSLADFEEIRVRTPAGDEVPLPELAGIDLERGYSEINRIDQLRSITITADVDEDRANAGQIVADLQADLLARIENDEVVQSGPWSVLGSLIHPASNLLESLLESKSGSQPLKNYPGISVRWEGQEEERRESMQSLYLGFIVALFGMFALLTMAFRSYLQPLIILAVIPFGTIGAIGGHLLMGLPLTLFSVFGMVALSGVVANDSIVLVDFINRRRSAGSKLKDALLDAGQQRFRAVILTSITTVAGLLPILLERSLQAQVLIPMAVSLSFGLMLATVWVLFLVPMLYRTWAMRFDPE